MRTRASWPFRVTDAEDRLKRLYRLVEDGVTDLDEVLKERLDRLMADRDRARSALEATKSRQRAEIRIDPALIEAFGRAMRENLTTGSTPFRKAYLRSLIDVIEVDDAQVRIKGSKDVLERAVVASGTGTEPRSDRVPSGAPRPMKMGTILSPWRYDAAAGQALQSANLRRPAMLRYATSAWLPDFAE